ncbi:MAG: hypothetical protein R3D25_22320 [Geminicoccaceae bacterium]
MLAVLPKGTRLLPVGGIEPATMAGYVAAGAAGFGLGSALFKPEFEPAGIGSRASARLRRCLGRAQADRSPATSLEDHAMGEAGGIGGEGEGRACAFRPLRQEGMHLEPRGAFRLRTPLHRPPGPAPALLQRPREPVTRRRLAGELGQQQGGFAHEDGADLEHGSVIAR